MYVIVLQTIFHKLQNKNLISSTSFVSPEEPKAGLLQNKNRISITSFVSSEEPKTGFILIIFPFTIRRMLSIIRCNK